MDIYHVIRRPLVTEKGTHQSQQSHEATRTERARGGSYAFQVHPEASKPMIRQAVEKIYAVRVMSVRTANHKGKARRYRYKTGTTRKWKKAVVKLSPEHTLEIM